MYNIVLKIVVSPQATFLQDLDCYRVSVGIVATHLTIEFAEWLQQNKIFSFAFLKEVTELDDDNLNAVIDMLCKNGIVSIES